MKRFEHARFELREIFGVYDMKNSFAITLAIVLAAVLNISVTGQKGNPERPLVSAAKTGVTVTAELAVSDGSGSFLRWSTSAETDVLGFNVFREGSVSGPIENGFVPGSFLRTRSTVDYHGDYSFFDPNGGPGVSYFVEVVFTSGKQQRIFATTTRLIPDLRTIAGKTTAELMQSARSDMSVESVEKLPPGELAKQVSQNLLPPDPVMQRAIAAMPGVKILVKQTGIYRVSKTALQNAGFDVSGPSSRWQLFVDGNQQAIAVASDDSYLEFYGEGMNTTESDVRAYFLVNGATDGKRMGTRVIRPLNAPVAATGFMQRFIKTERASYLSGILNGESENFFGSTPIGSTSTFNYNLNLSSIDYSVARSTVRVSMQGLTVNPHDVQVTINGQLMPTNIVFQGQGAGVGVYEIDTALLLNGANTIQLRGFAGASDFTVIESVSVDYSRKFDAAGNRLSFYTPNYKATRVSGFSTPNVRIFDLTAPDAPDVVSGPTVSANGPAFDLTIPSNRGRVLFAVEDSGLLSPAAIVRNYASTLSNPANSADMLIITHRDFLNEAQNWANYRTAQGTNSIVVDVADIFDENSYGFQRATAITEFLQYARDNWQTAPTYVLFFGDSTYDPKNYGSAAFNSYVPTELVDTLYEETGSDEAICDFNNDGLAEIAVGRIPARSGTEATQMLAKITQFEANLTNALDRGALFVSDQPIGYDFDGVNNRVSQQLPSGMPKAFISRTNPDARTLLLPELNLGRYIVNYSGHGSTLFWAATGFYHKNDLVNMTNQNNLSIFTLLTCLNGYFISPAFDSFAETAIKTPNGGAAIVWASSGKTTPDVQEVMATRFYGQIAAGQITRVGDLVKDAKQSLIGGRDVRLSWTLFGDPAMKVR